MSTFDRDLLASVKSQLRKRAFVPAGAMGQEDPAAAGPQAMSMGPGQGGPPGPPTGGSPQDPAAGGGGMPPGMPGDPTQATGGAAGGMDPNMPGGGPGQDPNAPAGQKSKNSGKINDITFLATEVGEIKGRMNLMLELMQGQMAPTKSASKKVAVDEQALWTLIEMLKKD